MTVITVAASIVIVAAIALPALGEVQRIRAERNNPIAKLRIPTRRHQVLSPSASGVF